MEGAGEEGHGGVDGGLLAEVMVPAAEAEEGTVAGMEEEAEVERTEEVEALEGTAAGPAEMESRNVELPTE